jgi:threonine/homoserine/homoserine lactone efflux protein
MSIPASSTLPAVIPIWGFVAMTIPLVLTPGASTAVVLRNSIAGGTRAGLITAIGINTGSLCYGLLSAFGFAVALQRWPSAWTVLRVTGVLYLGWLGVMSIRRAVVARPSVTVGTKAGVPGTAWQNVYEGFVTNILNPAIASFYLIVLPQFIPRGAPIARSALILTAVHIALAATWHVTWAAAGGTLARTLARGRPRQALEAATGIALIALAVKIAVG